jgi:hypothetical protein
MARLNATGEPSSRTQSGERLVVVGTARQVRHVRALM